VQWCGVHHLFAEKMEPTKDRHDGGFQAAWLRRDFQRTPMVFSGVMG